MITTTKFFVQHQRDAADFSDACEPICIGSISIAPFKSLTSVALTAVYLRSLAT